MNSPSDSVYLVSIIVPVYNVAGYLDQCFASIVAQTYRNLQVIAVDDGSIDGSGLLCNSWAHRDSRIEVIHQKNRGLSAARNVGIDRATGDYIAFIDSDDYVSERFVETLLAAAVGLEVECVACGFTWLRGQKAIASRPSSRPMIVAGYEGLSKLVNARRGDRFRIDTAPWTRIYARSLFAKRGIRFPEGRVYEGTATTFPIMRSCDAVALIPDVLYVHRLRPGSITQTTSEANLLDALEANMGFYSDIERYCPGLAKEARACRERARVASWLAWLERDGEASSNIMGEVLNALEDEAIEHWRDLRLPRDWPYLAALIGLEVAPNSCTAFYRALRRIRA